MATHLDLEEQEQLDQIKHFWNKWGTPITGVAVVVMGAFAAWNGYQYWQQRQAMQAAALSEAVTAAIVTKDQSRIQGALQTVQSEYGATLQASQAALQVARAATEDKQLPEARSTLQWVVDNSKDEGYQAIAKLRLAAVLMEEKDLDAAASLLRSKFPAEFKGLAADRLGDVLQLQNQPAQAIEAYQEAWKQLDEQLDYRGLVGFKLNALGVATPAATLTGSAQ